MCTYEAFCEVPCGDNTPPNTPQHALVSLDYGQYGHMPVPDEYAD